MSHPTPALRHQGGPLTLVFPPPSRGRVRVGVVPARQSRRRRLAAGRAVRVLPDGSFDGVVVLAPGENRIRATARDGAGAEHSDERVVHYERREARDAAEAERFDQQLAALRSELERRRIETELVAEIQAARARRRELELRAGEPPPAP